MPAKSEPSAIPTPATVSQDNDSQSSIRVWGRFNMTPPSLTSGASQQQMGVPGLTGGRSTKSLLSSKNMRAAVQCYQFTLYSSLAGFKLGEIVQASIVLRKLLGNLVLADENPLSL
jgi:hypothetical protein